MPKLTCECGMSVELTDGQRRSLAELACPSCGVTRKLKPLPPTGRMILKAILVRHGRFVAVALPALVILPTLWCWSSRGDSKPTPNPTAKKTNKAAQPEKPAIPQPRPPVAEEQPIVIAEVAPDQRTEPSREPSLIQKLLASPMPPIAPVPAGRKPALVDRDADASALRAIRNALENNLPDGKWTELEYWPTRVLQIRMQQPVTMARLKFRARNRFGAQEVMDLVFIVEDGSVRSLEEAWAVNYRRMFNLGLRITTDPVLAFGQSVSGIEVLPDE